MHPSLLPRGAGLGFKPEHFDDFVNRKPDIAFVEIHAENHMGDGGFSHHMIDVLRRDYALSVHGVGLSIGGEQSLDPDHLKRVAKVCNRFTPDSFSEHLAWSTHEGAYFNDLLPLPYTKATLDRVCAHVDQVQSALNRQILLENPATYVVFFESTFSETDFLREVARRTGCGLLLDINNVFVSASNHGFDAADYLQYFPLEHVLEIHLAGHMEYQNASPRLLIDTHDRSICQDVWSLYESVIARVGALPSLIEWDQNIPDFQTLLGEAHRASLILQRQTPTRRTA